MPGIISQWLGELGAFLGKPEMAAKLLCTVIVAAAVRVRSLYRSRKFAEITKDLGPGDWKERLRTFVQTRYEARPNLPPNREPVDTEVAGTEVSRAPLIPYLIQQFNEGKGGFYAILGDSGMGKSTLMLNLIFRYRRQMRPNLRARQIRLVRMGYQDTDKDLVDIESNSSLARDTIVLLDGFDEDRLAAENPSQRLRALVQKLKYCHAVVLTSRIQFFDRLDEEPDRVHVLRTPPRFCRLYLAPFDDDDVARYLNVRFPWWKPSDWGRRERARAIIRRCPERLGRPLLVSYIHDLCDHADPPYTVVTTYDLIADKWLTSEADRLQVLTESGIDLKGALWDLCKAVAFDIYCTRSASRGWSIPASRFKEIARQLKIDADLLSSASAGESRLRLFRTHSLLERGANGTWQFAHKSFLEYFLAKKLFEDRAHSKIDDAILDSRGFDTARRCYCELIVRDLEEAAAGTHESRQYLRKLDSLPVATVDLDWQEEYTAALLYLLRFAPSLRALKIYHANDSVLPYVSRLPNLNALFLDGGRITNFSCMPHTNQVHRLTIFRCRIDDSGSLSVFKQLKKLSLYSSGVRELPTELATRLVELAMDRPSAKEIGIKIVGANRRGHNEMVYVDWAQKTGVTETEVQERREAEA